MAGPANDDNEPLSYSRAKQQVGLSHVRQARSRINEARTKPVKIAPRPAAEPPPPPPPDPSLAGQTGPSTQPVNDGPLHLEQRIEELAAAIGSLAAKLDADRSEAEALRAKYEMELAAHRETVERLLQRQDEHITTLNTLVGELLSSREREL